MSEELVLFKWKRVEKNFELVICSAQVACLSQLMVNISLIMIWYIEAEFEMMSLWVEDAYKYSTIIWLSLK